MKPSLLFLLMLLLCYFCRAQTHSGDGDVSLQDVENGEERVQMPRPGTGGEGGEQELPHSDILAELRDLRDMVVEQKVELRHLRDRVTAAESLVEELQVENIAIKARMTIAESLVEELQMENDAQAAELAVAQQELSSQQQRVAVVESRTEELEKQQEAQKAAVQELRDTNKVRKVAFSASLLTSGEGNTDDNLESCSFDVLDFLQLTYRNVIANTGNHYNPNTGYFTAPVRGMYYFRFTGHIAHAEDASMRLRLIKNNDIVVTAGDRHTTTNDVEDNASNGAVVQLEVGDLVWVELCGKVWDDQYHRTTFSGFLLFPL